MTIGWQYDNKMWKGVIELFVFHPYIIHDEEKNDMDI
jgi:hypothetical protein